MLGVNLIDVEHWVGGTLEFAHSGISKTHTRRGGVLVEASEDDIWQLNRLGKLQGVVNFYECLNFSLLVCETLIGVSRDEQAN
jgi:hypothetical protein